jgi:asparagine synthase (glutamine-hydrolysing)
MNLFVVGWNLPKDRHRLILTELRQMKDIYSELDPKTCWHRMSTCGTIFSASMSVPNRVATPRRYVAQTDNQAVFFSGLPVNPNGGYCGHCAEDLIPRWEELTDVLEGQYVLVRVTDHPAKLELQTDILGYEQVFYSKQADYWLISNSVFLIEKLTDFRTMDALGAGFFLSAGWVGADRTLREGIRVIPAGQYWTWQKGKAEPKRKSYYPLAKLTRQQSFSTRTPQIKSLADKMSQPCLNLCQNFQDIKCTLTGGRDSRLIAALLIKNGLQVEYITTGNQLTPDVQIASNIAEKLNLTHKVAKVADSDILSKWDIALKRSIRQTDGMRSLFLIRGIVNSLQSKFDRKQMILWGAGGEIARCFYGYPYSFPGKLNYSSIVKVIRKKRNKSFGGLVTPDIVKLVEDYIKSYVRKGVDDGFKLANIPDAFGMYQGDARRIGNNMRGLMMSRDVFSPFCTRAFVEAAFAIPLIKRYAESLHYRLILSLSPELHRLDFDKYSWPQQQLYLNIIRAYRNANKRFSIKKLLKRSRPIKTEKKPSFSEHYSWFESKRNEIQEVCMDHHNSIIWDFVDRSVYEKLMSTSTDPIERSKYIKVICNIATLFYYENDAIRLIKNRRTKSVPTLIE